MRFIKRLLGILPLNFAYAHCDIPCGIYDPTTLQLASHTVLRMTKFLLELGGKEDSIEREHTVSRVTHVKEHHGALVEKELGTFKNDYFKEEHYSANPELKEIIKKATVLSAKVRQTIDEAACQELVEEALKIAEIFYKTKNVTPVRVRSIYPTEGQFVTYKE